MSDTRGAWADVGNHLSALALKLKLHLQEETSSDEEGAAGEQDHPEGERLAVKKAWGKLSSAVEETFAAVGDAARDPAVKDDVKRAGEALVGALRVTFDDALRSVRPDR